PEAMRMLRAGQVDVALVSQHTQSGTPVGPPAAAEGARTRLILDEQVHLVTRPRHRGTPGQPGAGQPGGAQPGSGQPGAGQPAAWRKVLAVTYGQPPDPRAVDHLLDILTLAAAATATGSGSRSPGGGPAAGAGVA